MWQKLYCFATEAGLRGEVEKWGQKKDKKADSSYTCRLTGIFSPGPARKRRLYMEFLLSALCHSVCGPLFRSKTGDEGEKMSSLTAVFVILQVFTSLLKSHALVYFSESWGNWLLFKFFPEFLAVISGRDRLKWSHSIFAGTWTSGFVFESSFNPSTLARAHWFPSSFSSWFCF